MSMESDLVSELQTQCATVRPVTVSIVKTPAPFVVWQLIGGRPLRYADNSAADKRMSWVQIRAWAGTHAAALSLIRAIEDRLCASTLFVASPDSEPVAEHEDGIELYGMSQDFTIVAAR